MAEKEIENGYVARYCKRSDWNDSGVPERSAFQRRKKDGKEEKSVSVYLLEFFKKQTELENVIEVKKYMKEKTNFNCKQNGFFAVINIE